MTVALTTEFLTKAKAVGMTDAEIDVAVDIIAANPTGGVSLGAGLYKVRVPREGAGKRGGYRVVSLYLSDHAPAVLLSVLSKSGAANFSDRAMNTMKEEARSIRKDK